MSGPNVNEASREAEQAFRQLAKSICVVTVLEKGQGHASPATAVCNLANAPPSLLVCIEKTASLARLLAADAPFALNVLGAEQGAIVENCVRKRGEARFAAGDWREREGKFKYLHDAQANFFCHVAKRVEFDTHHVVIARILDARSAATTSALVYLGGNFVPFSGA